MLPSRWRTPTARASYCFNGHPPLGVNATTTLDLREPAEILALFQWAPTLGGECYMTLREIVARLKAKFQWAPTLGGECYSTATSPSLFCAKFQWAPTLGGECYIIAPDVVMGLLDPEFQSAPTLGGECYHDEGGGKCSVHRLFQWAPTLGGECYL